MGPCLKVAVIGTGAAGLIAARELQRENHRVTIFEKADQLGGTWVYDPQVEADQLGLDSNREIVHSSLYFSLRTNLPRQLMGFSDYPFGIRENGDRRNFPRHEEVLRFLNDFAREFGITELIRFGTEVVRVERVDLRNDDWVVESRTSESNREEVLVMIGNGPSAFDISREIATVAKEVHLSSRSPRHLQVSKLDNHHNIWQHSKIVSVCEDGTVAFEDGSSVHADTSFHCTGYKYNFPFLKTNGIESVIEDKRVGPLYKHVFPPKLAPSLSFIGIPERGITFLLMELQSKWIARVLSGKLLLPSEEEMLADVQQHYLQMDESQIPKHHTHLLDPFEFGYMHWLAAQVGLPPPDQRLTQIFSQIVTCFILGKSFRDEMDIESLTRVAA
ncbi:Flavin-containing monooxygenase FMO GS-OX5 [Camellia lanceoleosa]|uniref:Flavin-containing monooxygenase FMO GS-OX5 n=1 Tax=Camellia lanceoleosa TaxID=1840588 RepID=A0ACC0ITG0_9ERIC|nr:Flavin-containing monooxygenase FMO GS-OX5 [Camellia lanceoleosa]